MKGATALIISSLTGFGLDFVHQFARRSYNVVLNGNITNDEKIVNAIQNEYQQSKIIYLPANIEKEIDIHTLVEQILNQFQRIDVLIINNECKRHYQASIDEFPVEKWKEIIDYNLIPTFALVKTVWPYMKRQHFGRIINIVCR